MQLSLLIQNIIPFYLLIIVGYIAGKKLEVRKEHIAPLLIYIFLPCIMFFNTVNNQFSYKLILFLGFGLTICLTIFTILLVIGKKIWKDKTPYVLGIGIANGNFGFLGIPLTLILLPPESLPYTLIFNLAGSLFLGSIGVFFISGSEKLTRKSILKVLKVPILLAFVLGVLVNLSGLHIPQSLDRISNNFISTYSVLGLILIGVALSSLSKKVINKKLIVFSLIGTFVLWPVLAYLFVNLDIHVLRIFPEHVHKVILLMSLAPIGASVVGLATEFKLKSQESAFVVFITTLISIVYIPIMTAILKI